MKRPLTILALSLTATAQAQFQTRCELPSGASAQHIPEQARMSPEIIMQRQIKMAAASKSSAAPLRLKAWTLRDLDANQVLDTSYYTYSGNRGTAFRNESENLLAGISPANSRPDRFLHLRAPGQGDQIDIRNTYDAADRVIECISSQGGWADKTVTSYDAAGLARTMIESDSLAGGWKASRMFYYRHNAAKQRLTDSVIDLDSNEPAELTKYHYNAGGDLDTIDNFVWTGRSFDLTYRTVCRYASVGLQTSITSYCSLGAAGIVPSGRTTFVYTSGARLLESETAEFRDGSWHRMFRDTMSYHGSGVLYNYLRSDAWDEDAGAWAPIRERIYSLNAKGRWNDELLNIAGGQGSLIRYSKMRIDYNASGTVAGTRSYLYDFRDETYFTSPFRSERYYYENDNLPTAIAPELAVTELSLFPNPASQELTLDSRDGMVEGLAILGAAGQRLAVPLSGGNNRKRIDVSALPAGVYLLHVRIKGQSAAHTLRFVRQ
jgi:hypothetical protein